MYDPAGHENGEHAAADLAPTSVANSPGGQGVHAVAPLDAEKVPAAQRVHTDEALAAEDDPASHGTHNALRKPLAAVPLDTVPAAQGEHTATDDAPTALELKPGGQGEQSEPGDALKEPGKQREHDVAAEPDELPAAHGWQAPTVPVTGVNEPGKHGSQSGVPSPGADENPAAQGAHVIAASVEIGSTGAVPLGQGTHEEEELYTEPRGQATHEAKSSPATEPYGHAMHDAGEVAPTMAEAFPAGHW